MSDGFDAQSRSVPASHSVLNFDAVWIAVRHSAGGATSVGRAYLCATRMTAAAARWLAPRDSRPPVRPPSGECAVPRNEDGRLIGYPSALALTLSPIGQETPVELTGQ